MGLALHNSGDAALDLLSHGPPQVTPSTPSRSSARLHYKGAFLRADGSASLTREHADVRLPLLDLVLLANHRRRAQRQHRSRRRPGTHHRSTQQWRSDETAEGRALAIGSTRLPGENTPQLRRTPSLERQGAFRAPRTAKSHTRPGQDESDDAELYRLGLLYDDEHLRGSGFELDAVACRGPEYALRPAKRTRRRRSYEDDLQLALDLSLAELGRDEAFARYLLSPDLDESPSDDESAELAPYHFVSQLIGEPEPLSVDLPELTTDSDSDDVSLSSYCDDECWAATARPTGRRRRRSSDAVSDEDPDDARMVLGDGS